MSDSVARNNSLWRMLLWMGASAPVLLAFVFHAIGATPQPAQPGEPRPALAFHQHLVNLGSVEQVGMVRAFYAFTNRGSEKVHISELETSCGCLVPRLEKRDYEPGETGEFFVYVDTPNAEPGEKEYLIQVRYEDPEPRQAEVTFKMNLEEQMVSVRPKGLLFYLSDAAIEPREVVVTDKREKPLEVTGIESTSSFVTGTLQEVTEEDARLGRTRISVSIDPQTPAGVRALLILSTTDPSFPKLHFPVSAERIAGATIQQVSGEEDAHLH